MSSKADQELFGALLENTTKLGEIFEDISMNHSDQKAGRHFQNRCCEINDLQQLLSDSGSYWQSEADSMWTTMVAKVVTAFRDNEKIGKIGAALLLNKDNECMLVMYKSKSNILASVILRGDGRTLYKQSQYWQFYDENSACWTLYFSSENDEKEFSSVLNDVAHQMPPAAATEHKEIQTPTRITKTRKFCNYQMSHTVTSTTACQTNTSEASQDNNQRSVMETSIKFGKSLPQLTPPKPIKKVLTDTSDTDDGGVMTTQSESIISSAGSKHYIMERKTRFYHPTAPCTRRNDFLKTQCMKTFMHEQRSLGSDLRSNVHRIEQKVETMLQRLNLVQKYLPPDGVIPRDDEIIQLEEKILSLMKENRHLKQISDEKDSYRHGVQIYTETILNEYKEQMNSLNISNNCDLKTFLNKLVQSLNQVQEEVKDKTLKLAALSNDLRNTKVELEHVKQDLNKQEDAVRTLQGHEMELKRQLQDDKRLIDSLKKDLDEEKRQASSKFGSNPQDVPTTLKAIMNQLYLEIATKLHSQADLSNNNRILSIIGNTIREQTLKTLRAI